MLGLNPFIRRGLLMNRSLCFTMLLGCALAPVGCNEKLGLSDDSQTAELINTTWMLQSIDVPDSTSIEVDPNKIFSIQFFEDFQLSGINDCNEYFGIYNISHKNSLSIDSLGTSLANCAKSIDREYYRALHFVNSYEIINNMLLLYYDENNSILNYLKAK